VFAQGSSGCVGGDVGSKVVGAGTGALVVTSTSTGGVGGLVGDLDWFGVGKEVGDALGDELGFGLGAALGSGEGLTVGAIVSGNKSAKMTSAQHLKLKRSDAEAHVVLAT